MSVCGPPPVRPSRTGRETPAAAGSQTLLIEKALLFQHVEILAREQPVILGRVPPLREDAGQIGQSVRAEQFGRLGDEFSVIMEKSVDDAKEITSKFMDNYKEKRSEKMPYISYGVAIYDPKIAQLNYETIEDAIKEADKEMYEYKRAYKKRKSLS